LSRRQIQALCHSQFGLAISVGAIQAIIERAAEACESAVEDLAAAIKQAKVVSADETGAAHQGGGAKKKRHWLWVAAAAFGAIYLVAADRGTDALRKLLGDDFKGIVGCDRWRPYETLYGDNRQICWAHLGREGQSALDRAEVMLKSKDEAVRAKGEVLLAWGKAFMGLYKAIFKSWGRFKDGEYSRAGLRGAMTTHKLDFAGLLRQGALLGDKKVAGTSRDLLRQWPVLWTFVTVPGVEPTNNEAERALRQPVLLRKKSQGTRSDKGKTTLGTLLGVVETCRRQSRSVIDFLETAIQNRRTGLPPPSLLPA
jgi:transposase